MVGYYNAGVPTSADLENNSHQKKYTVNQSAGKNLVISKPLCTLMAIGALLLAILAGLVVFFLVPRGCDGVDGNRAVASLTQKGESGTYIQGAQLSNEIDERLPRSIKPLRYTIQLMPDFKNSTTEGTESINLRPLEDTNTIIFHADKIEIDIDSVKVVRAKNTTEELPITHQHHLEGERYRIVLGTQMLTDNEYILSLNFTGELNDHLQGFYKCQYPDINGEIRKAASTQFSPTDARKAFPCFDEPSFKAKFQIKLARPSDMSSLSNMPNAVENTTMFQGPNGAQWFWDHYPETPEMSTYLVAFIISDLVKLHSTDNDPLINIWARREFLTQTDYAGKIAPKILRYFENYFRTKFPLPKIDIVAVPEFGFTAMENWGLITFRENSLLFDNYSSTVEDQKSIATVLSHEIAHQWFGNLVTPKWWNDLWLKEGFATYLEYIGVNHVEPKWNILEEFLPDEIHRAMELDSLESSRPLSFDVFNSAQIRQTFDAISYSKGACIIRMMNHFLGEETFKNGLIKYLKKFQYGNADRNDLFTSLTEEVGQDSPLYLEGNETVKDIMDTWTEQAGFPVVNVDPDYERGTLKLVQKRFLLNDAKIKGSSKWWIPVSFTSSLSPDFVTTTPKFWIRGETEVDENVGPIGDWYLLNLNQTGYYIVNYDEKNWRNIIDNIMSFPPLIRAQLISDSMDLARANHLNYDIPLRLIARMAIKDKQIMFVPTAVALKKLKFLSDILFDTPAFGWFEKYHKAIFKYTYDLVDFNDSIDDYITRRIRKTVLKWSCRSSDSICSHEARALFRNWMTKGIQISPNLRSVIYCTSIREGSEVEWEFANEKLAETTSPNEKTVLLDALGCTKYKWLLSRYLDKLIDPSNRSIRIQDADRVFESVARNKDGSIIAFDFLRKHWNEMLTEYGDGFGILGKMVKSLAVHMTTEFQLKELERFRDSVRSNISTTTQSFDAAIEKVRSNVAWMKKNYEQVDEWLKKHKDQFEFF